MKSPKKLNEEQKQAVEADENILLTACPGSGKTRVIVHKVAYELQRLSSTKKRIAAVTFTNRAADEIHRRINNYGINTDQLWTGTIHSFCLEWILRPYSCFIEQLQNGFIIADEAYCTELLLSLKEKYGLERYYELNLRFKKDGTYNSTSSHEIRLLDEYYLHLFQRKEIDFNQLLLYAFQLLKSNNLISKTLANIFCLICVDEYQDTQDLQYAIISELIKCNTSTKIFLVGDPDQAIYGSLGGVAKPLDEIRQDFERPIKPLTLSGNYRSSQRIIDFYRNFQVTDINITARGLNAQHQGLITFNKNISTEEIIDEICRLIEYHLQKGVPEKEICILVPQWRLITSLTKKLRMRLPATNFDSSGISLMAKIKENIWYKISRLFLCTPSPDSYSSRNRWTTGILSDLETILGRKLFEAQNENRMFLRTINEINSTNTEIKEFLKDCFMQLLDKLFLTLSEYPALENKMNDFFAHLSEKLTKEPWFPADVESYKRFYSERNGIVINTCVGIKGEEFETVIAYGLLHGYIPHWNEIFNSSDKGLNASKKLLYVICSRAKNNLHLLAENDRKTIKKNLYSINKEIGNVIFDYDTLPRD